MTITHEIYCVRNGLLMFFLLLSNVIVTMKKFHSQNQEKNPAKLKNYKSSLISPG